MEREERIRFGWVSAALVALAWPAAWLLWAPAGKSRKPVTPPRAPVVNYIRQGVEAGDVSYAQIGIRPAGVGLEVLSAEGADGGVAAYRALPPQLLTYAAVTAGVPPSALWDGRTNGWRKPVEFSPAGGDAPVYLNGKAVRKEMSVELSSDLVAIGFRPAEFLFEAVPHGAGHCVVVATVEGDDRGNVGNVFLDAPGDNAELNLRVIRALQQGKAAGSPGLFHGTVTVTFRAKGPGK